MNFIYIREFYDVSDLSKSQIYVLHLDDQNVVTQKIPSDEKQAAAVGATIKNVASPGARFILIDEKGNPYVDPNMEATLAAQAAMQLTMQAQTLLDKSDVTLMRCVEKKVSFPDEWVSYRDNLRLVISGKLSVIPTSPNFPAGT
jgi:hypothetical protein